MAVEIEMKLALKDSSESELKAVLFELSKIAGAEAFQETALINRYYDTKELQLNHAKIALRIRSKGGRYIQTLKTKGAASNGLHRRGEWEWELDANKLDASLLNGCDAWPKDIDMQSLVSIFETNFVRRVSKLRWRESEVELAYDSGAVAVGDAHLPIREIELELLSGNESALLDLAQWLQERLDLEADDVSKAERGYYLYVKSVSERR